MPDSLPRIADPDLLRAALAEAHDVAVVLCDLDGIVRAWSSGAERLYGRAAGEAIGQPIAALASGEQQTALDGALARIRAGSHCEAVEPVPLTAGGEVDLVLAVVPVVNASASPAGAVVVACPVGSRLRAERALLASEARWRAVLDSAVDGIVVIDTQGRIETFNPAAERMFGYSEAEVRGKNVALLMPSPDAEAHDRYIARYLETGEPRIIGIGRDVTGRRRDGSTFPLHLSVGEFQVGGERRFTGVLRDLTGRVQMEAALREQTALAHLGQMAAVIAHEVKNPLAAIRGAIQVVGSRLPADGREAPVLKEVVARIDALNELVQDLLLFARPPELRRAPVEIAPLLARTAELLAKDPRFAGVRVEVSGGGPPLLADPRLLQVVLENLLLNAAQAMPQGGTIHAAVAATNGEQRVTIADEGPGIPAEQMAEVFRPFFTTRARGTGLGLPTVKRLVEAHGGSVTLDCPPEGGTRVTVRLPAGGG